MRIDHDQAIKIFHDQLAKTQQIYGCPSGDISKILQNIEFYVNLLLQWNGTFNLIAPNSVSDLWGRHLVDSLQIWPYLFSSSSSFELTPFAKPDQHLVDLGTGAGLPGLVLAILGWKQVSLVESNQKKCLFLHEVVRQLSLPQVRIIHQRIEEIPSLQADIVVGRALAPLKALLDWAYPHLNPAGRCLFHKGKHWQEELTEAQKYWTMMIKVHPSITDATGVILEIDQLSRGHAAG